MDLENIMLSEKDKYCMSSCICGIESNQIQRNEDEIGGCQGLGVRETGEGGHRARISSYKCSGGVASAW